MGWELLAADEEQAPIAVPFEKIKGRGPFDRQALEKTTRKGGRETTAADTLCH